MAAVESMNIEMTPATSQKRAQLSLFIARKLAPASANASLAEAAMVA